MLFRVRKLQIAAAVVLALLVFSGCTQPPQSGDETPELSFKSHPTLGDILTDPEGRTLYVFTNDEPGESKCYGGCATNWPPYLENATPAAPSSISSQVDLVTRTDGSSQVAYRDRPLYYWANDARPGDATGDGVGGVWFVVRQPPTNSEMLETPAADSTETQDVQYFSNTTGFFARPSNGNATTGVVMIHEWSGLNDNIRDMARLLAAQGYLVLAVDLFHGNVATTSEEAQQQVGSLDQAEANDNMKDAAEFLRGEGAERVASLGWCFGGGQSLQLALSGEPLAATVIYYGFLETDESRLSAIDWPVLGIFGEKDQAIPIATVRAFERSLTNVSVESDIYVYPDVGHAFANPSGDAWAPEETQDAWARTLVFLAEHTR